MHLDTRGEHTTFHTPFRHVILYKYFFASIDGRSHAKWLHLLHEDAKTKSNHSPNKLSFWGMFICFTWISKSSRNAKTSYSSGEGFSHSLESHILLDVATVQLFEYHIGVSRSNKRCLDSVRVNSCAQPVQFCKGCRHLRPQAVAKGLKIMKKTYTQGENGFMEQTSHHYTLSKCSSPIEWRTRSG